MNNINIQQLMVSAARGWVGTPFHHQGRQKQVGVDCLGLLVGVAEELSLCARTGEPLIYHDARHYSHTPDGMALVAKLKQLLYPISSDRIMPGDVAVFRLDGSPQHLGVISDYGEGLGLIHAYAPSRGVVEHALDKWWMARSAGVFRISE